MMAKGIEIEWVHSGFEQILCSEGTMQIIRDKTSEIQQRANANNARGGAGYTQRVNISRMSGSRRANGSVYNVDEKGYVAETEDKALSRAVM